VHTTKVYYAIFLDVIPVINQAVNAYTRV